MKPLAQIETWEVVSKRAYWDRDVLLDKWRGRVAEGHNSYLPDAVTGMDVSEFIHFYGVESFVQDWPLLRAKLPEKAARKAGIYDLAWGRLAGGGWNLRPFPEFGGLPERRRQFLVSVAKTPGRSIYQVAKGLGMQYRRAHEHAVYLIRDGKVRSKEVVEDGLRKTKLYPAG